MTDRADRYFVNDLPGATMPASRLGRILDNFKQGRPLSVFALEYMSRIGLLALCRLARGEIAYEAFCEAAREEQGKREQAAEIEKLASEATRRDREARESAREIALAAEYEQRREQAAVARRERESDPRHIAKMRSQRLRERFGLDRFIARPHLPRLMQILHRLASGSGTRCSDDDLLWLSTEGKDYFSELLQAAFHEREAEFYAAEYKRTDDPWNAVNASGHYRKCNRAEKAHDLLTTIPAGRQRARKLESALCTTHGGVMRDLKRLDEALELGNQAHRLMPKDFRPCTLLGAVNFELGNYAIGNEWYVRAAERGASERSIDYDLRGILQRADTAKREEIKAFLLRVDPLRYRWVSNLAAGKSSPGQARTNDKPQTGVTKEVQAHQPSESVALLAAK